MKHSKLLVSFIIFILFCDVKTYIYLAFIIANYYLSIYLYLDNSLYQEIRLNIKIFINKIIISKLF